MIGSMRPVSRAHNLVRSWWRQPLSVSTALPSERIDPSVIGSHTRITSSAPAATACLVSATFTSRKLWPEGNAVATEATRTANYLTNNLRDDAGHYFTKIHEPNGNAGITGQIIHDMDAAIMSLVMPGVNAGRTHPIKNYSGAFAGNSPAPPGAGGMFTTGYSRANVDLWVYHGCDGLAVDIYANLAVFTNADDFAGYSGLVLWAVPELGTSVTANSTDGAHLTHLNTALSDNAALTHPASPLLWFDSGHNLLDTTLAGATIAGATTLALADIPGPTASTGTWSIANGAQITIDPHGAHPETVTLTAAASFSNQPNGPYTPIVITALAFPHASGVPVWVMPTTVTKIRTL